MDMTGEDPETAELFALLAGMVEARPELAESGGALATTLRAQVSVEASPAARERHVERFARDLRALWLRAAGAEAAQVMRSPSAGEAARIAGTHDSFGYERDLQPDALEARCDAFFPAPPAPWAARHMLFSSGQAALTCVLLGFGARRPLRVRHLGGYFETRQFIESSPALCVLVDGEADVVIAEPVESNGGFDRHEAAEIVAATAGARALLLDTTLLGRADAIASLLPRLDPRLVVLRCASGLKLLQGGLELANVGIVGVHAASAERLEAFTTSLRTMRTLCGAGLRFADMLALEAPWVFERGFTDRYADAIFAHNAALAEAVSAHNRLFVPPFTAHPAPYCVFALRDPDPASFERLAQAILNGAREQDLNFVRGGSFGFRNHRYEIVHPQDAPPFLRVAMGRRPGWSCAGVTALLARIAATGAI